MPPIVVHLLSCLPSGVAGPCSCTLVCPQCSRVCSMMWRFRARFVGALCFGLWALYQLCSCCGGVVGHCGGIVCGRGVWFGMSSVGPSPPSPGQVGQLPPRTVAGFFTYHSIHEGYPRPTSLSASAVDHCLGPLPVPIRDVAGHCHSCAHIGVRIVSHTVSFVPCCGTFATSGSQGGGVI